MEEDERCQEESDNICHDLACPVLWHLTNTVLPGEESIFLGRRLSCEKSTKENIQRLATAHGIYHKCKNDHECIVGDSPAAAHIVQARAVGFARACHCFAT